MRALSIGHRPQFEGDRSFACVVRLTLHGRQDSFELLAAHANFAGHFALIERRLRPSTCRPTDCANGRCTLILLKKSLFLKIIRYPFDIDGRGGNRHDGQLDCGQDKLFYSFNLDNHVPRTHLLRGIDRALDLGDLRQHLMPFYSPIGRP